MGKAGAGKTTIAEYLGFKHKYYSRNFSAPIKEMLSYLPGLEDMNIWEDRSKKEENLYLFQRSPRYFAQTLGTEWGRQLIHEDIWVICMEIHLWNARSEYFIIPDVRFQNEADWIERKGGILASIIRNIEYIVRPHSSEDLRIAFPPNRHYLLDNEGTVTDLYKKADDLHNFALRYWEQRLQQKKAVEQ
jgi:hypothetical protein